MNRVYLLRKRLSLFEVDDLLHSLDETFYRRVTESVGKASYVKKLSERASFEVAKEGERVLGVIAFYENEKELYISYVCVEKSKRKQGVADLLMRNVCCYAEEVNKNVSLEVRISNYAAIRLYSKFGFKIVETYGDKYYMTKFLI